MFRKAGHYIGDTWYYTEGDTAHMFYLTCPDSTPRHTRWNIGHASSKDLINWQDQGVILTPGDSQDWDGICPATGSVVKVNERYWMAYTGNYAGPVPTIGFAVSDDLYQWTKYPGNPVLYADGTVYGLQPNAAWNKPRWRDPFLTEVDGVIHMFITASTCDTPDVGVIAHATSTDMHEWQLRTPLKIPAIASDLECAKVHKVGDLWNLTVSIQHCIALPSLQNRQAGGQVAATAYCLTAPSLRGPYCLHGDGRILTGANTPYACEPILFKNQWYLLGTCWNDDTGDCVSDPIPLSTTAAGFRARSAHTHLPKIRANIHSSP